MRRNMMLAAVLAVLALVVPMTGHAFTRIASCSSSATATNACPVTFTCPVHPINLRAIPGSINFIGVVDVTVSDGTDSFTHSSEWITGRIQIDGPSFTTVQMAPFVTCTLSVTTSAGLIPSPVAGGSALGVVEA